MTLRWSEKQSRFPVFWFSRFPVLNPANPSILSVLIRPCETYQTVIPYTIIPSSQSTMRIIAILSLLLLASPVFGELTKEDLRTIIKEEVRPIIKEEITASEKHRNISIQN